MDINLFFVYIPIKLCHYGDNYYDFIAFWHLDWSTFGLKMFTLSYDWWFGNNKMVKKIGTINRWVTLKKWETSEFSCYDECKMSSSLKQWLFNHTRYLFSIQFICFDAKFHGGWFGDLTEIFSPFFCTNLFFLICWLTSQSNYLLLHLGMFWV